MVLLDKTVLRAKKVQLVILEKEVKTVLKAQKVQLVILEKEVKTELKVQLVIADNRVILVLLVKKGQKATLVQRALRVIQV
jgi:predicted transcriptional regulator